MISFYKKNSRIYCNIVKKYHLFWRRIAAPIWKLNMPFTVQSPRSISHSYNYSPGLQIFRTIWEVSWPRITASYPTVSFAQRKRTRCALKESCVTHPCQSLGCLSRCTIQDQSIHELSSFFTWGDPGLPYLQNQWIWGGPIVGVNVCHPPHVWAGKNTSLLSCTGGCFASSKVC